MVSRIRAAVAAVVNDRDYYGLTYDANPPAVRAALIEAVTAAVVDQIKISFALWDDPVREGENR